MTTPLQVKEKSLVRHGAVTCNATDLFGMHRKSLNKRFGHALAILCLVLLPCISFLNIL